MQRKTIAFFTNHLEVDYAIHLWNGIRQRCKELNINFISVAGSELQLEAASLAGNVTGRNKVYDVARQMRLDGILISAPVFYYCTDEQQAEFLDGFNDTPIILLNCEAPNAPAILVDGYVGMRSAVEHLIDKHQSERILFFRGPEDSPEAEDRYRAYRDVLIERNINLDSNLVKQTTFDGFEVSTILQNHITRYGVDFDAAIGSNDMMALSILNDLPNFHNIPVPSAVKVIGFDNIDKDKFTKPTLSSVAQPIAEMGALGVDLLKEAMAGYSIPMRSVLPATLTIRHSCGCLDHATGELNKQIFDLCVQHLNWLSSDIAQAAGSPFLRQLYQVVCFEADDKNISPETLIKFEQLIHSYLVQLNPQDETPTSEDTQGEQTFQENLYFFILNNVPDEMGEALVGWDLMLRTFLDVMKGRVQDQPTALRMSEKYLGIQALILEFTFNRTAAREAAKLEYERALAFYGRLLNSPYDISSFRTALINYLPKIELDDYCIALSAEFAQQLESDDAEPARERHDYSNNSDSEIEPKEELSHCFVMVNKRNEITSSRGQIFVQKQLLPAGLPDSEEPYCLALFSLTEEAYEIGHWIFTITPQNYRSSMAINDVIEQTLYSNYTLAKLRKAEAEAQHASEAKSSFLANMSHEIRTPMNGVLGMASLLSTTELSTEQTELVKVISQSGQSLLSIINEILDYSKLEIAGIALEHELFDLYECAGQVVDLLAPVAAQKGLYLCLFVEPALPQNIWGDADRLRQVFINLVGNAIKFTETGGVFFEISKGGDSHSDNAELEILFRVIDTGIGIPIEAQKRLFSEFTQADSSTTRKYGGTGLGLAISKKLIEQMAGDIVIERSDPSGSVFCASATFDLGETETSDRDCASSLLTDKTVAIIDWNHLDSRSLVQYTTHWGMNPNAYDSIQAAEALVQEGKIYDVIVLDEQAALSTIGDVKFIDLIRRWCASKPTKVLLLVHLDSALRVGNEQVDFASTIHKPIKPIELSDILKSILSGHPVSLKSKTELTDNYENLAKTHPRKILLVEDNVINQKVALKILLLLGYEVELAMDGLEAVRAVEQQPFDIILMDVQMPKMNGLDATKRIRQMELAIQPLIIAMSASAMTHDHAVAYEAGMDDFVDKPVSVNDLRRVLTQAPVSSNKTLLQKP